MYLILYKYINHDMIMCLIVSIQGTLPHKLDSESRLHTARSILSVPETEGSNPVPKSSVSDSRLAVDYFVAAGAGVGRLGEAPAASDSEQSLYVYTSGGEVSWNFFFFFSNIISEHFLLDIIIITILSIESSEQKNLERSNITKNLP